MFNFNIVYNDIKAQHFAAAWNLDDKREDIPMEPEIEADTNKLPRVLRHQCINLESPATDTGHG